MFGKLFFLAFTVLAGSFTKVSDGFDPGNQIDISVISQAQAEKLFNTVALAQNMSYKYLKDGCYARTTAITRIAEKEQIYMGRIYAEGLLRYKTNDVPIVTQLWGWHISAVVSVLVKNKPTIMVIDPSLFSKPVTEKEWEKALQVPGRPSTYITTVYYGSRFQYKRAEKESRKNSWQTKDLIAMKEVLDEYSNLSHKNQIAILAPIKEGSK
jgi:hypothetical protein